MPRVSSSVLWKLLLVVVIPLLLYGRSGVFRHPAFRLLMPYNRTVPNYRARSAPERISPKAVLSSRTYVAVLVLSAVAIASWVATRAWIGEANR